MSNWPKVISYYLHSDKESNYEKAAELGLSDEATDNFRYCCYEVKLTVEVHEDGKVFITHVGKQPLAEKVAA